MDTQRLSHVAVAVDVCGARGNLYRPVSEFQDRQTDRQTDAQPFPP